MPSVSLNNEFVSFKRAHDMQQITDNQVSRACRSFGAAVHIKRKERNWSLTHLGARMGIGKSMLAYLEAGERAWSLELAEKAVRALKLQ